MSEVSTVTYTPKEIRINADPAMYSTINVTVKAQSEPMAPGTVLGKITASGLYDAYDNTADTGIETAAGILADAIAPGENEPVRMYIRGVFREADMVGLDSAAKADLPQMMFI